MTKRAEPRPQKRVEKALVLETESGQLVQPLALVDEATAREWFQKLKPGCEPQVLELDSVWRVS